MPYVLEKLLRVRQHRENRALNQLAQRKAQLSRCESVKLEKERQLADYSHWRKTREKHLFDRLKRAPAGLNDLMCFTDAVNTMRQGQARKAQEVAQASEKVHRAQSDHQAARRSHVLACRRKTKIEEHKNIWTDTARLMMERDAEKEVEELAQSIPLSL